MTLVDELKKKTNAAVDLLLCRTCTVDDKDAGKDEPGIQNGKPSLPPINEVKKKPRNRGPGTKKADKEDERIRSLDLKTKEANGQYSGSKTRRVSNPKQVRSGDHTTHRVRQPRELSVVNGDTAIVAQGKRKGDDKGSDSGEGRPRQDSGQVVKLPDLPKPSRKPRPPKTPPPIGPVFIDQEKVVPKEEVDRIFDLDDLPCGMSARPRTRCGRREPPAKSASKDTVPDPRRRRISNADVATRDDSRARDRLDARRAFVVETSPRVEARRKDYHKSFKTEAGTLPDIDLKRTMLDDPRVSKVAVSFVADVKPRNLLEDGRIFNVDASPRDGSRSRDGIDVRRTFEVKSPMDPRQRKRIDAKIALQAKLRSRVPTPFCFPGDMDDLIGTAPTASPKTTTLVAPRDDPLCGLDTLLTEAEKYEDNRRRLLAAATARRPPTASSMKCQSTETLQSFPSTQDSFTSAASAGKSITSEDDIMPKTPAPVNASSLPLPNPLPPAVEGMKQYREMRKQEMQMIDDLLADLDL